MIGRQLRKKKHPKRADVLHGGLGQMLMAWALGYTVMGPLGGADIMAGAAIGGLGAMAGGAEMTGGAIGGGADFLGDAFGGMGDMSG